MTRVAIELNCRPGVHVATVIRERADGRRVLDLDGGPLLEEGVDCAVVGAADDRDPPLPLESR